MKKIHFNNAIYFTITAISLVIIMFLVIFSNKSGEIELKVGDISQEDIYAPRSVIDKIATEEARREEREKIKDIYVHNPEIVEDSVKKATELFEKAARLRKGSNFKPYGGVNSLRNEISLTLSTSAASEIMNASAVEFSTMTKVVDIIQDIMENQVSNVSESLEECNGKVNSLNLNSVQKEALYEITSQTIVETLEFDKAKTEAERQAAADKILDIECKKNQIIVRKGDEVTDAQIYMLTTLGMLKGTNPISFTYVVGVFLLILICYAILSFFFWNRFKQQLSSLPILSLTALLIILISFYGNRYLPENMFAVLPFGLFPGIAAIFSSSPTAIISNLILSIFCGIVFDANWSFTVCLAMAGTMSAYSFAAVKRRSHLLPAAVASSVFYALAFCAMSFIEAADAISAFAALGKGFLGGILSGLITIGSIQFFEWMFNATTPMKLSELTNPENKLLKKLLVEAPGSYHHALTVANISEIAARSIKADSLLARVGAYYHDIGKIRHPLYFKENQYDRNAHDDLTPEQSSSIIISHVTDGVDIAQKNRLPKVVCDIISQHHGTTTTGYFLIRARELDPDVDEAKFTYPGPIPQTKEAAIVMLADSCEAAVRSISEKSEAKIEAMVRKIATERVNSGQFSQCNLTFAELEMVIKVITKTLGGYFHERIKYE